MKRLVFTLFILLCGLSAVFAQRRSVLKIRLTDDAPIMIRIDDRYYEEKSRLITVDNIISGRHRLKVFIASKRGFSNRALVYDGYVQVRPGTMNYLVIDDRKGTMRVNTSKLDDPNAHDPIDKSKYPKEREQDRHNNSYRNARHLSEHQMNDLKERVEERITDTEKIKLLKSILSEKAYTTEQTSAMISWLAFESSKLEFVQWAYDNVTDKDNFWKLERAFDFSSSKEELNDFIQSKK